MNMIKNSISCDFLSTGLMDNLITKDYAYYNKLLVERIGSIVFLCLFFSGHVPRSFDRVLRESWAGDEEVRFIYVILCELKHRKQGLRVEQQQSCRVVCSEAKSCESVLLPNDP